MKCSECKHWAKKYSNDCGKAEQHDWGTSIRNEKSFWIESVNNKVESILFTTADFYCVRFEQK